MSNLDIMNEGLYFRNVLLCEDIRDEVGNKSSIIGVFSGDVIVPVLPATLQLAVYAEFLPPRLGEIKMEFLFKTNGELVAELKARVNVINSEAATIKLPKIFLTFEKDSTLSVDAKVDDEVQKTLFSKRVFKGVPPVPPSFPISS